MIRSCDDCGLPTEAKLSRKDNRVYDHCSSCEKDFDLIENKSLFADIVPPCLVRLFIIVVFFIIPVGSMGYFMTHKTETPMVGEYRKVQKRVVFVNYEYMSLPYLATDVLHRSAIELGQPFRFYGIEAGYPIIDISQEAYDRTPKSQNGFVFTGMRIANENDVAD